jgi:uncharacterized membrane protein YadS
VKLVRTLMIIPICLGLAALTARRQRAAAVPAAPGVPVTPVASATAGVLAAPVASTASRVFTAPEVPAASAVSASGATPPCGQPGSTVECGPVQVPAQRTGAAGPARMSPRRVLKLVPWFLIGFVLVAAVNSAGIIPAAAHGPLQHVSVFLVAVALSAIGLSTNVAALRKAGPKPLLLGALLWITVAAASLALQTLTSTM